MNYETKRDVFDETLSNLKKMDAQIEGEWGYSQLTMGVGKHGDVESTREIAIAEIRERYAAALPDDLPVIPKAVGEYLEACKRDNMDLYMAMDEAVSGCPGSTPYDPDGISDWFDGDTFDAFARAWLDGVLRVEETGEIVKLEAEK